LKALRTILYFAIDLAVASLGVAISESQIYHDPRFPQPSATTGIYEKEFLISAGIAFIFGFFVYRKLKQRTTLWVWAFGICLLVIRVVIGSSAESQGIDVLGILSIRMVFYSLGAITCSCTLREVEDQSTRSREGIASLLWLFGVPPKLPKVVVEKRPSGSD
jgi:hypothetical protein